MRTRRGLLGVGVGVGVWIFLAVLRFLFHYEIWGHMWILTQLLDGCLLIVGIILMARSTLTDRPGPIVTTIALIGGTSVVLWLTPVGEEMGQYSRLLRNEPSYQSIVDKVLSSDAAARSVSYPVRVDPGPPVRVAFSWGGLLDNWSGVVFDPTGAVLKARQFKDDWSNWHDPRLAEVKSLFGGDLRWSRHLWGHWYYCVFT